MNIYLGEHFEQFIRDQVATGRYANASEVVREALRLQEERLGKLASLQAAIKLGQEDVDAGRVTDWTPDTVETVVRESRNRIGLTHEGSRSQNVSNSSSPDRAIAEGSPEYR